MRKILMLLVFLLSVMLVFSETNMWATAGAQLIGQGPVSRSMGGTGIANPQSAVSSIYLNPATMTYFDKVNVDFGATIQKHNITTTGPDAGGVSRTADSRFRPFALPAIGFIAPIGANKNMAIGLAMVTVGGMGTDYRNTKLNNFGTLMLMQLDFIPAWGMKLMNGTLRVGVSLPVTFQLLNFSGSTSAATDPAYGVAVKLGAAVDLKSIRLGAYFKHQFVKPKHETGFTTGTSGTTMTIQAPTELGLGGSFIGIKKLVLSLDFKYILWSSAAGYGDKITNDPFGFDWKNQFVISFGGQYDLGLLKLRLGYAYASTVLRTQTTSSSAAGFNVRAPAVSNHHITLGAGMDLGKGIGVDLGFVYALKAKTDQTVGTFQFKSEMSQWSIDIGLNAKI